MAQLENLVCSKTASAVFSLVAVSGPTCSGKSALGFKLAQDLSAEILSVDSVQVYRQFDIGSAKPKLADRLAVPHHLIDIRDPNTPYNVAEFVTDADAVLTSDKQSNKPSILVGGTSLYLNCLLNGLAAAPGRSMELRAKWASEPTEALYAQLCRLDKETADRLMPGDRVRIERALETIMLSGKSISKWQSESRKTPPKYRAVCLIPLWSRSDLYRRISDRTLSMLSQGLLDEVRLIIKTWGQDLPGLTTLGYAQACSFLKSELAEEELASAISQETRRYAKRQMTFWRNEPLKRNWTLRPGPGDPSQELISNGGTKSKSGNSKSFSVLPWSYDCLLSELKSKLAKPIENSEVWYLDAQKVLE